jgi:hypothetical protein
MSYRRNGNTASAIFAALCTAGIVTLCSQASFIPSEETTEERPTARGTAYDVGERRDPLWGELVPASLERGAEIQLGPAAPASSRASKRLRLK